MRIEYKLSLDVADKKAGKDVEQLLVMKLADAMFSNGIRCKLEKVTTTEVPLSDPLFEDS